MSLVNPNPPGWALGDIVTYVQINSFGTQIASALDKSSAGDSLFGSITMQSTAALVCQYPGNINANATAAVQATVANSIESTTVGGIGLAGGATDWPTFYSVGTSTPSPRTRTLWVPGREVIGVSYNAGAPIAILASQALSYLYTASTNTVGYQGGAFLTGLVSATSLTNQYAYMMPLRSIHNGATLTGAVLSLKANPATRIGLPNGNLPAFGIFSADNAGNIYQLLGAGTGFVSDTSGTFAAYTANHTVSFTPTVNNTINSTSYSYFAIVLDECGTSNTQTGNLFYGITLSYGSINTMAFP